MEEIKDPFTDEGTIENKGFDETKVCTDACGG